MKNCFHGLRGLTRIRIGNHETHEIPEAELAHGRHGTPKRNFFRVFSVFRGQPSGSSPFRVFRVVRGYTSASVSLCLCGSRLRCLTLLLLGASFLGSSLNAQTASSAEPPATVDIAFHVMQVGRASVPAIRYATGQGASAGVELRSHQRTGPYRYRGPNPIVFFRDSAGADGQPVREPVGSLRMAKEIKQALVFAIPRAAGATGGDELGFVAIDDSRGAFGPDKLVIYNALPVRVGAVLGTRRFVIEPGPGEPIDVKALGRGTLPVEFWIETAGGAKLVLGGEMDFTTDTREVMILLPPRRAGSWIIQSVRIIESMNTPPAGGN